MRQAQAKQMIGIPPQRKNILFAGRIEPLKGIDTLVEAIALLNARHATSLAETCVTIIGGDPWAETLDAEMERLQKLRDDLGLEELVTFAGARDQEILPSTTLRRRWWSCPRTTRALAWWRWRRWRWARR
jgi:D-inositol-3-phosphate glycosyltransferase